MVDTISETDSNLEDRARRIVAEYGDSLYETAVRFCGNEKTAEDYTFRTLERALRKIGCFQGKSSLFTWLYRIMMNLIRSDLRKKAANALDFREQLPEEIADNTDPGTLLDQNLEADALSRAIAALPIRLRTVVVFRYYEDLTIAEIAEVLGISRGTVKMRLFNAKNAIRAAIAKVVRPETVQKNPDFKTNSSERASNHMGKEQKR